MFVGVTTRCLATATWWIIPTGGSIVIHRSLCCWPDWILSLNWLIDFSFSFFFLFCSEGVAVAGRLGNVRNVEETTGGTTYERVPVQFDQPARVHARGEAQIQRNRTLRLQVIQFRHDFLADLSPVIAADYSGLFWARKCCNPSRLVIESPSIVIIPVYGFLVNQSHFHNGSNTVWKRKKIPSRTFSRILGHFMDSLKHLTDSMRCFGYFTKGFVVVVPVVLVEFVSSALLLGFFFFFSIFKFSNVSKLRLELIELCLTQWEMGEDCEGFPWQRDGDVSSNQAVLLRCQPVTWWRRRHRSNAQHSSHGMFQNDFSLSNREW